MHLQSNPREAEAARRVRRESKRGLDVGQTNKCWGNAEVS